RRVDYGRRGGLFHRAVPPMVSRRSRHLALPLLDNYAGKKRKFARGYSERRANRQCWLASNVVPRGHCAHMANPPFGALLGWLLFRAAAAHGASHDPAKNLQPPAPSAISSDTITRGRAFLVGLLDPRIDLLPEYRGCTTYWLFHDNYLAAHVLASVRPELSQR